MAFDEYLAERIDHLLAEKHVSYEAKKMMGGLCYMVNDKMCFGVVKNTLMARINPAIYDLCLQKEGCSEMNFTGKSMKGFVFVDQYAIDLDDHLEYWVQLCLDFNPYAKSKKKK
ncbi:TfoX/Sxy family protein [Cyclobacteriaceae bacterium]|nr:TfoX/Sxy family protein [Cyclobacteriaceae bacterium]